MILVGTLLLCSFIQACPLEDKGRPEDRYPYYHNTKTETPIRKVDNNNYPRPVPLHEEIKKVFKK
jgi:hypothetical protein